MGWFWAEKSQVQPSASSSSCPVSSGQPDSETESACPVMRAPSSGSYDDRINPLNNIPFSLSRGKQTGQRLDLPTERTTSTIPKGDRKNEQFWEYPSPQQMYNAMVRKGKIDPNTGEEIPEDAVESMVFVHNFLNEGCWQQVLEWESKYTESSQMEPKLLKFMGRPTELSPRARWFHLLSYVFPSHFSRDLPFDRHDWVVLRPDPSSLDTENPGFKKVRYIIDFYGGADDEDGLPTFNLDVRPALDSFSSAKDRFEHWTKPILDEYLGPRDK
ncbi:LAMI_0F05644g1_1 [Lachancea mirantina]|uniref:Holocytochrome c-type synthase n=1 Tax=Lachancea mirantina TaxID=1230905 RepID=A0A1G4JYG2_9SACH|nr:LAMI_0F05644g1_1 [Lachancea mirantina]